MWADDGDYVKLGTVQTFYEESYKGGKLAKDRDFFLERQMKQDSEVGSHDTRNGFHNGGQHPTRIVNYMRRKWGKTKPDDIIHRNVAIYNKPSAGNMPSEDSRGKGSTIGVIMLPFVLSAIWLATLLRKTKNPSAAKLG
jgi:hypothetical protein